MECIENVLSGWKNWKIWEPGSETSLLQKNKKTKQKVLCCGERTTTSLAGLEPPSCSTVPSGITACLPLESCSPALTSSGSSCLGPCSLQNQFYLQGPVWRVSEGRKQGHVLTLFVNTWGHAVVQVLLLKVLSTKENINQALSASPEDSRLGILLTQEGLRCKVAKKNHKCPHSLTRCHSTVFLCPCSSLVC